jgi:hypothetical protein
MALWGKQDAAAPSTGTTVGVTNASTAVTGVGTSFLTDLDIGDVLIITSGTTTKNRVAAIASNTALTLADNFTGTTAATLAIANVKIQQQPKYAYQDSNSQADGTAPGKAALEDIFGVDATEQKVAGNKVGASPGWVRRIALTGGKSGRVQVETLVAGRNLITGDAADDAVLADS